MKYKLTLSTGMAGRVSPDDNITEDECPRYGFYWWYYIPHISSNGGLISHNKIVNVSFFWLCFWVDFIFWPNQPP